jgi:hypothetical protein
VLADVSGYNLPMLLRGVGQDVLDQVVAILIAGDVDERNTRAIGTTLADTIQVAVEKVWPTNLEALLNDLGRKLVGAVLASVANDVINGSAAVARSPMLADVLNAPVAELTVGDNVDVGKNLFDAGTLSIVRP